MNGASLARVLARPGMGGVTYRHLREMQKEGLIQKWEAEDGSVALTRLFTEPVGKVCVIYAAEGDIRPLLELHEKILAWASAEGCKIVRISGRRGWLRVLPPGYKEVGYIIEKTLDAGDA
jgi:hypothetical protein